MPKREIDYSKLIIYKIVCNDDNITDCYVGQTTNFSNRKWGHKNDCNNAISEHYNVPLYQFIRLNGGWDNFSMLIIEHYPCESKEEALKREQYWVKLLKATLNTKGPVKNHKHKIKNRKHRK